MYLAIWTNCKHSSSFLWPCSLSWCLQKPVYPTPAVRGLKEGEGRMATHTKIPKQWKNDIQKCKSTKVQICKSDRFPHQLQLQGGEGWPPLETITRTARLVLASCCVVSIFAFVDFFCMYLAAYRWSSEVVSQRMRETDIISDAMGSWYYCKETRKKTFLNMASISP